MFDKVVSPFLVSIDGPDGAGKSTLAEIFTQVFNETVTGCTAKVIRPSYFSSSVKARLIGVELENHNGHFDPCSKQHNDFFLRAMQANFHDQVRPALEKGTVVVLDSSEIRALAFTLSKCESTACDDTKQKISDGSLTDGLLPQLRIVLNGSADDLWKNLLTKGKLDCGDPQNIDEVRLRQKAYCQAYLYVKNLHLDSSTTWLNIEIVHQISNLQNYLAEIVKSQLLPQLFLSLPVERIC